MRAFRDRLEQASLEVQTPNGLGERLKSHPMDVDSDSEASFTSALDNYGDFSTSTGVQQGQESPASSCNTASKMHQQASSQRADFIASSTPTSLSKAQGMAFSMQSLAHEAALAAAKRAGKVSKSIDAAASPNQDYASDAAKQQGESGVHEKQPSSSTVKGTGGSLADITNWTHDRPGNSIKKDINTHGNEMSSGAVHAAEKQYIQHTAAKGYSVGLIDWTLSTLYFSAGVAAAVQGGVARGLRASTKPQAW